jgi:hypothetical protein
VPVDHAKPDLATALPLDPYAPREARHRVSRIGSPSPDLRDAIVLLTSELVTRAVWQCEALPGRSIVELRAWLPRDIVRVELKGPPGVDITPRPDGKSDFDLMLLEQLTDRWSGQADLAISCVWFEIDRAPVTSVAKPEL